MWGRCGVAALLALVPFGLTFLERDVVVGRGRAGRREVCAIGGDVGRGDVLALAAAFAAAVEELHLEGDHFDLGPLGAILGLPGGPVEPSVDAHAAALGEMLGQHLRLVTEDLDVEEVRLVGPVPGFVLLTPVDRQTELKDGRAGRKMTKLRVAGEAADERDAVDVSSHEFSAPRNRTFVLVYSAVWTGSGSAGAAAAAVSRARGGADEGSRAGIVAPGGSRRTAR